MISRNDLRKIARARLKDAEVLLANRRYDSAVYLCGYAIELVLKARICQTLKWSGFPETSKEFQPFQSLKTHSLVTLLSLSGQEQRITSSYLPAWSVVAPWDPEARYKRVGTATRADAVSMIDAARVLMRQL
jgi:HEPN domain-containing protein